MGKYKIIMLNTNVFCRPFDDLSDPIIKEESALAEKIFELAENKKIEILASDILYAELELISDHRKRDLVLNEIESVAQKRIGISDEINKLAGKLINFVNDYSDCLHIAFAAISKCDSLVTCDKSLIKAREKIESFLISKKLSMDILNPEEFIERIDQNGNDIN